MNNQDFCRNMKYHREDLCKLTFMDLAAKLKELDIDVSAPTLQRYETGKIKTVPYETVIALAQIFEIAPQELLGFTEQKSYQRTTDLNKRMDYFVQELIERPDAFFIDDIALTKADVDLLRLTLEAHWEYVKHIILSAHK